MDTTRHPRPPDDLDGEALLEWHRITAELDAHGLLDTADRAIITLYVQTWAANQNVARHVAKYGPVIKWSNGVPGQGPWYATMKETSKLLASMLDTLGLTPAARIARQSKAVSDDATDQPLRY